MIELKAWLTICRGLLHGKSLEDIQYDEETEAARYRHMTKRLDEI